MPFVKVTIMPKSVVSKLTLITLSLFTLTIIVNPASAQIRSAIRAKPVIEATPASETRNQIQERIETRKNIVDSKLTAAREQKTERLEALKAKLLKFRNQDKANIAEKINTNLNNINQNQTNQMNKHLAVMSTILEKLENRVKENSLDIKSPEAVKVEIAVAKQTISSASAMVSTQAEKDYTIQITTESRIKVDSKKQRDGLHQDLQAVRKYLIDAKQSVANAIRTAKIGVSNGQ